MSTHDYSQRFLFEDHDIRGEFVRVESSYQQSLENSDYPLVIQKLLGEMICASILLSSIIKYEGHVAIHAQGHGPASLLIAECNEKNGIRATAHINEEAQHLPLTATLQEILQNGQLAITIQAEKGKPYQGIVPLSGDTLAHCLETYFLQSEQLPTRIYLAANSVSAGGLLLQQLPSRDSLQETSKEPNWEHLSLLLDTLTPVELTSLSSETLIHRLFSEENIRVFNKQHCRFHCRCSREKTLFAIATMEHDELEEILAEKDSILVDCQFCNTRYEFQRSDLHELNNEHSEASLSLH